VGSLVGQGVQFHGNNSFGRPVALGHVGYALTRRRKYLYAPLRRLDFPTSVLRLIVFFVRATDDGVGTVGKRKELRRANDNGSCSGESLDLRIPRIAAARTLRASSRCFVLSLSIQPVVRCKATMLSFGVRRGCYSISKKQRSGSVLLSIISGRSLMTAACDTLTSVAAKSAHATALPRRI
jgi:hypothetical protein